MEKITRKQAIALGLKRYFTGKPCPSGHIAPKGVASKGCIECSAKWKKDNIEHERVRRRKWDLENRERIRKRANLWAKNNPGKFKEYKRRWALKNPEKLKARNAQQRREHPEYHRASEAKRRAKKLKSNGSHTFRDAEEILKHQRGKCAYCRIKLDVVIKRNDHIVALARGGSNSKRNIQVLCDDCNRKKWAKDPIDFAREIGLLI